MICKGIVFATEARENRLDKWIKPVPLCQCQESGLNYVGESDWELREVVVATDHKWCIWRRGAGHERPAILSTVIGCSASLCSMDSLGCSLENMVWSYFKKLAKDKYPSARYALYRTLESFPFAALWRLTYLVVFVDNSLLFHTGRFLSARIGMKFFFRFCFGSTITSMCIGTKAITGFNLLIHSCGTWYTVPRTWCHCASVPRPFVMPASCSALTRSSHYHGDGSFVLWICVDGRACEPPTTWRQKWYPIPPVSCSNKTSWGSIGIAVEPCSIVYRHYCSCSE